MLHDADYTPWFGAAADPKIAKSPNISKLEDRLLTSQGITLLRNFPGRKKAPLLPRE